MSSDPFLTSDDAQYNPPELESSDSSFDLANCEAELLSQVFDELGSESGDSDGSHVAGSEPSDETTAQMVYIHEHRSAFLQ
jgi:hypothetical protein